MAARKGRYSAFDGETDTCTYIVRAIHDDGIVLLAFETLPILTTLANASSEVEFSSVSVASLAMQSAVGIDNCVLHRRTAFHVLNHEFESTAPKGTAHTRGNPSLQLYEKGISLA